MPNVVRGSYFLNWLLKRHRETEVLALAAHGPTNAEVGRRLSISEAIVKTHLLRSFGKLGVNHRTAVVTSAIS